MSVLSAVQQRGEIRMSSFGCEVVLWIWHPTAVPSRVGGSLVELGMKRIWLRRSTSAWTRSLGEQPTSAPQDSSRGQPFRPTTRPASKPDSENLCPRAERRNVLTGSHRARLDAAGPARRTAKCPPGVKLPAYCVLRAKLFFWQNTRSGVFEPRRSAESPREPGRKSATKRATTS